MNIKDILKFADQMGIEEVVGVMFVTERPDFIRVFAKTDINGKAIFWMQTDENKQRILKRLRVLPSAEGKSGARKLMRSLRAKDRARKSQLI